MLNDTQRPLSAAEIVEHPEFDGVVWDLKPAAEGFYAVAKDRWGPINLSYEIHGNGPIRLVWIMGLGALKTAWQRQTKDFGHSQNTNRDHSPKYSCLIFDNRGMGLSDKPLLRYTTSEMAKDTLELIDHVGWTSQRQLHIIGISMGGMIAQELAMMIPDRIASLSLLATGPRLINTSSWIQTLRERINLFIPRHIDVQLANTKERLFTSEWLNEPDAEGHFPTNGDRFAAQELMKRRSLDQFTGKGFVLQALAAATHNKSAKQLKELGDRVGRERILVVHGVLDRMITFTHGEVLAAELGGPEKGLTYVPVPDRGHGLPMEWRKGLTKTLAPFIERTEAMPKSL